ncbi:hypothetical protein EYF80_019048 [Liparis tanakae]|uniref:Uncharacterized protein n=1 Tax=Liparis tanakae TaxID=230148 RepID=A0A4Z2HZJ6_9TELE|nr:hypothetical protein EYF80_019048 [Liparis tanakae]
MELECVVSLTSPFLTVMDCLRGVVSSLMLDRKFWEIRKASCRSGWSGDFSKLSVRLAALLRGLHSQLVVVHKRSVDSELAGLMERERERERERKQKCLMNIFSHVNMFVTVLLEEMV